MHNWTLYEGDCLEVMRQLPSNSVDASGHMIRRMG